VCEVGVVNWGCRNGRGGWKGRGFTGSEGPVESASVKKGGRSKDKEGLLLGIGLKGEWVTRHDFGVGGDGKRWRREDFCYMYFFIGSLAEMCWGLSVLLPVPYVRSLSQTPRENETVIMSRLLQDRENISAVFFVGR
jgi:hypothetical protein